MRRILIPITLLLLSVSAYSQSDSLNFSNISKAKVYAKSNDKFILMIFAGSDWCRPCIQFKKEILENEVFRNYAKEHLAVLYLDFPARKKNRLSEEQTKHNESLAEKYNPIGYFPKILLMDKDEKILGEIIFKHQSPDDFIQQCENLVN